jgi:hypothetical protein
MTLPDSDPLLAMFRAAPPLVREEAAKKSVNGEMVATISLDVEGHKIEKDVHVPLQLVPIPIPTLLVLKSDPNDPDWPSSKIFVMVRLGSAMKSASDAIQTLNNVIQLVNSVKDLLNFTAGVFDLFIGGLSDTLDALQSTGFTIAGFAVEEAPDLDDFDDFDDEARFSIMFGPVGTKATFYSGEDYNGLFAGDNESSQFVISDDFGAGTPINTGFGIHRVTSWQSRNWDTDSDDNMNDCESCNFGESKET